jgi:hypothetical protein
LAIVDLARLTSGTHTQTDSVSRSNAIQKALRKVQGLSPIQDSVLIGNVPSIWPELTEYVNDNRGLLNEDIPQVPPPEFIWDQRNFPGGEVRYFAQAFNIDSIREHVIFTAVFADNAHRFFIEERAPGGTLIQSFTPDGGLVDGLMVPQASQTDDTTSPYNWQKIRLWSSDDIDPQSANNFFVFSFEVMNYLTADTVNPAGLAYLIDIYRTNNA